MHYMGKVKLGPSDTLPWEAGSIWGVLHPSSGCHVSGTAGWWITERLKLAETSGSIWSNTCSSRDTQSCVQDHVQVSLKISKETPQPLWALTESVLCHNKEVLHVVQTVSLVFQFVLVPSCHREPQKRAWLHCHGTLSSGTHRLWWDPPDPHLLQTKMSQRTQPFHMRGASAPSSSLWLSVESFPVMSMSLVRVSPLPARHDSIMMFLLPSHW